MTTPPVKPTITGPAVSYQRVDGAYQVAMICAADGVIITTSMGSTLARSLADSLRFWATEVDRFNAHNALAEAKKETI